MASVLSSNVLMNASLDWFHNPDVRPYVFVRDENHIQQPGAKHRLNWFNQKETLYKNPLNLKEIDFAEQIYFLEGSAFGPSNMAMPRWVFYDCAVLPGFVAGFAWRTSKLPENIKKVMKLDNKNEWTPLSLFIIIPTMKKGEWVAHNLCSINSLLPKEESLYGLGFLSKAFGLWYANVDECTGMTQWGSPALKLHSHYGHLEIIGAYAPIHTYAKTVTYRVRVNTHCWEQFFTRDPDLAFLEKYRPVGSEINPQDEQSMISLQNRIEQKEGPFFLNANEIAMKNLSETLSIYVPKD